MTSRTLLYIGVAALFYTTALAVKLSAAGRALTPAQIPSSAENRRQQLLALFDEEWQYGLRTRPEFATALGDKRYNDRLSDESPSFFQSNVEQEKKFLERCEAIDPRGLSHQDSLSRELMIRDLRLEIEGARFKPWETPVNQMSGPHLRLPDLVVLTPFDTVQDYDNYVARLNQIPR